MRKFVKFVLEKNKEAVDKAKEGYLPIYDDEGKLPKQTDQKEYYESYLSRINDINKALFEIIQEEYESFDPDAD